MDITVDQKTQQLIKEYIPQRATLRALADFFNVLGDSTRIKVLSALSISPLCVGDIAKMLNINQTTLSHQLRTMRDMGMVDFHRKGKVLLYYIVEPRILDIMLSVAEII